MDVLTQAKAHCVVYHEVDNKIHELSEISELSRLSEEKNLLKKIIDGITQYYFNLTNQKMNYNQRRDLALYYLSHDWENHTFLSIVFEIIRKLPVSLCLC